MPVLRHKARNARSIRSSTRQSPYEPSEVMRKLPPKTERVHYSIHKDHENYQRRIRRIKSYKYSQAIHKGQGSSRWDDKKIRE